MDHNHSPSGHLIPGCDACRLVAEARNQALNHLAEAVDLLATIHNQHTDQQPVLRMNLAPIDLTGDGIDHCRSIDLTAKLAEALADAVDSMAAHAGSEPPAFDIDTASLARRKAELMAWMEGQTGEAIPSGEFSAAAVAQYNPDLYADVTDLFLVIDPQSYLDDVVNADCPEAAQAAFEQLVTGEWDGEL
jgi:hypothetical protein